ncbi:MAG: hypothetical protein K2N11_02750, partial [Mucispirillum sp.]|nr:hypothetical protein [Mucispirillum sp.]
MALKKVSEVAKKAGVSVDDALKVLQASGVHVSKGDDTVKDEDVAAAGLDKRGQLDRRQEMLQKALERHKKGVKIKEVVVNNKGTGSQKDGPKKLSKEDLKMRKKLVEQQIKKVDEDRIQYNKDKAAQQQNVEHIVKETAFQYEMKEVLNTDSTDVKTITVNNTNNTAAKNNNTVAASNNEAAKNIQKQNNYQNVQSHQNSQNRNQDRPKEHKKDDRRDKPFNKDKNKPNDRNKSFSKDRNEKSDKPFNRSKDKGDKRFQDRDKDGSNDRFRDNKGGKNQQSGSQQRINSNSVFITGDEDRKRIVKKKEDENKDKDKESKKPKNKKDGKHSKSWMKTINEGMDELT